MSSPGCASFYVPGEHKMRRTESIGPGEYPDYRIAVLTSGGDATGK